jgi:hypothetical protein
MGYHLVSANKIQTFIFLLAYNGFVKWFPLANGNGVISGKTKPN